MPRCLFKPAAPWPDGHIPVRTPNLKTLPVEAGHRTGQAKMRNGNRFTFFLLWLVVIAALIAACRPAPTDKPTSRPPALPSATAFYLYSDEQVLAFLDEFPGLIREYGQDPERILQQLSIDLTALEKIEQHIGGCICLTVYKLSPGYELVVDLNLCTGYNIAIRKK